MNPLLAAFHNRLALIEPSCVSLIEGNLDAAHMALARVQQGTTASTSDDDFWFDEDDWRSEYRPYRVRNGVLTVPVKGSLMNDFPWQVYGYVTGYEYLSRALMRGADDPEVSGIALVLNSGGGLLAGNFHVSDLVYQVRERKPVKAIAAHFAYSAAYSIASAAEEVVVGRGGGLGSVGVVRTHYDMSSALKKQGISITFVLSGKHKVDGNFTEPLADDVREDWQNSADAARQEFAEIVARNRGISAAAVLDTEARTYDDKESLAIGFADRIGDADDEIAAFAASLKTRRGVKNMAETTQAKTYTQAEFDAAVLAARSDGSAAAMARINAIIGHEAAVDRPKAALNAALKTTMPAEEAVAFLAVLPSEAVAVPAPQPAPVASAGLPKGVFAAVMGADPIPDLQTAEPPAPKDKAAEVVSLIHAAGLPGFRNATK